MKQLFTTVVLTSLIIFTQEQNLSLFQSPLQVIYNDLLNIPKCNLTFTDWDVSKIIYFVDFPNKLVSYGTGDYAQMASDLLMYGNMPIWYYFGGFNEYFENPEIQFLRYVMKDKYISIYCDTSEYTTVKDGNIVGGYERAVQYLYPIGKEVAKSIVHLKNAGIVWKNIHVFAQSLSCNIVAHVGQSVINMTNGTKMYDLHCADQARPCFDNVGLEYILDSTDAENVLKIHSNAGELGTLIRSGTADFYGDNEGFHAKQCMKYSLNGLITPVYSICSHYFSVVAFMACVQNNTAITATQCSSYDDYNTNKCAGNHQSFWGPAFSPNVTGWYYFNSENDIMQKVISNGILQDFTNNFFGLPLQ